MHSSKNYNLCTLHYFPASLLNFLAPSLAKSLFCTLFCTLKFIGSSSVIKTKLGNAYFGRDNCIRTNLNTPNLTGFLLPVLRTAALLTSHLLWASACHCTNSVHNWEGAQSNWVIYNSTFHGNRDFTKINK